MKKHFRLAALLLALALNFHTSVQAATLVWTNSAGGLWSNATNWSPNGVPGAADSAVVTNTGTYTITSSGAVTVADLTLGATNTAGSPTLLVSAGTFTVTNTTVASNGVIFLNAGTIVSAGPAQIIGAFNQASGTWQLKTIANVNVYNFTNGEQRGGTLTVTNFNWIKGDLNADANGDKLIIPTNGVVNFPGAATRNLSYYAPATRGRDVDNLGVWNWGGDSLLYGVGPAVVNNYGTVTVTNSGVAQYTYYPGYASPVWNNFSTFNKAAGAGTFYFNNVILNNYATLAAQAGVFSIYNSTFANSGSLSINGAQLQFYNTTGTNSVNIFLGGRHHAYGGQRFRPDFCTVELSLRARGEHRADQQRLARAGQCQRHHACAVDQRRHALSTHEHCGEHDQRVRRRRAAIGSAVLFEPAQPNQRRSARPQSHGDELELVCR